MKIVFNESKEDFQNYYAAERWVKENGYHRGTMQADAPIALAKEDWVDGEKWRNITREGQQALDGIIAEGDKRNDDVTIIIFDEKDLKEDYLK